MSKYNCLYIDSDEELEDDLFEKATEKYKNMINKYKEIHGDYGITNIDLTTLTITEIKQLNYAYPSDWEGTLSNDMKFYSRYRGGWFRFFVYNKDHKFRFLCDSPLIDLYFDCIELKHITEYSFMDEEDMLKICKLKLDHNCIRIPNDDN